MVLAAASDRSAGRNPRSLSRTDSRTTRYLALRRRTSRPESASSSRCWRGGRCCSRCTPAAPSSRQLAQGALSSPSAPWRKGSTRGPSLRAPCLLSSLPFRCHVIGIGYGLVTRGARTLSIRSLSPCASLTLECPCCMPMAVTHSRILYPTQCRQFMRARNTQPTKGRHAHHTRHATRHQKLKCSTRSQAHSGAIVTRRQRERE